MGAVASRAVDGNRDGYFRTTHSCAHTDDIDGWWAVDLGTAYSLDSIDIYQRLDQDGGHMHRLTGITAVLSFVEPNDEVTYDILDTYNFCASQDGSAPGEIITLTCADGAVGRYLYLYLPLLRDDAYLTLCEVEISGSRPDNHALGGTAWQSSDWTSAFSGGAAVATRAVDGNRDGQFRTGYSCAHTNDIDGWWAVDLQQVSTVASTDIYQRLDGGHQHRLTGITAVVSNVAPSDDVTYDILETYNFCASQDGSAPGDIVSLTCADGAVGRYVYLYLPLLRADAFLTLCEVEIFTN